MFRASQIYGRATPAPRPAAIGAAPPRGKGGVDWNDSRVRDRYRDDVAATRYQQSWQEDPSWGKGGKNCKGGKPGKDSWYAPAWGPGSDGFDDGWWSSQDDWGKSGGKGASADGGWWSSPSDWGKANGKGAGADGGWRPGSSDWGKAGSKGPTSKGASADGGWQPSVSPGDRGKTGAKGSPASSSGAGRGAVRPPPASSSGSWRPRAQSVPARPPTQRVELPPVTPNTITVQGSGLQNLGDKVVDEAIRQVAINGGFSVHERLVFMNTGAAHVEFPHAEAAGQFLEASGGELTIEKMSFKVRQPVGTAVRVMPVARASSGEDREVPGPDGETPTDSLMIKNLADTPEQDLREAFEKIAPRLKGVKIIKDYAGHFKGMGTVSFYEIHEAAMALRHFRNQGCIVAGRKTIAEFLAPSSFEQKVEHEDKKHKADESLRASHEQALTGVNADMWASYIAMFKEQGGAEESEAKRPRFT